MEGRALRKPNLDGEDVAAYVLVAFTLGVDGEAVVGFLVVGSFAGRR